MGSDGRSLSPAVLILTEDGSAQAPSAILALANAMCRAICPGLHTPPLKQEPLEVSHRKALSGNRWRSDVQRDHRAITQLVRLIAAHLKRCDGFVIFHFDGDLPYQRRGEADKPADFDKKVRQRVRFLLESNQNDCEHVEEMMTKLIVFTPFSDMEGWTYYNTRLLLTICRQNERAKVESWASDPGQLEEEHCVSRHLTIGKSRNHELAKETFPTRTAIAVGKSFADAAKALSTNRRLMEMLERLSKSHQLPT